MGAFVRGFAGMLPGLASPVVLPGLASPVVPGRIPVGRFDPTRLLLLVRPGAPWRALR